MQHYENFPVASLLCPAPLRPAVVALYRFARTADDLADEGDAPPEQRTAQLARYRAELTAVAQGALPGGDWPEVFGPLAQAMRQHDLPVPLLHALLDAFASGDGEGAAGVLFGHFHAVVRIPFRRGEGGAPGDIESVDEWFFGEGWRNDVDVFGL